MITAEIQGGGTTTVHVSVMPSEVSDLLRLKAGGQFLDCTLGGGGHTTLMLTGNSQNEVMAIDRDARALERASTSLQKWIEGKPRLELVHASFADLSSVCGERTFDGVLADLGLSSDQIDEDRGFSFNDESALDMRMDESSSRSADEVVNNYPERDLFIAFKQGGVGENAKALARAIVRNRPIVSSKALADLMLSATPKRMIKPGFHPATVPFQAIRMEVNQELQQISQLLDCVPNLMKSKGRFAAITFHSGEDKLVAQRMRRWESGEALPAMWRESRVREPRKPTADAETQANSRSDLVQQGRPVGTIITRKPVVPSEEEVARNSRARSARLRVFEFD